MNKKKLSVGIWVKLVGAYSLFVGIIAVILLFGFTLSKQQTHPIPIPTPTPKSAGTFCGGIAGKQCPTGYTCKLSGNYPDAGGTCIRQGN